MSASSLWLRPCGWRGLAVVLPVVVVLHVLAASVTIRQSNQDWRKSDQGAEIWMANQSQGDWFPQRTDGVRHPLWSWMARFLFVEDVAQFFARGKWLNTAFCVLFLCGLGVAVARWLDGLATANLLLLCSLGILLVRGTYFQPEPIYYILFFVGSVVGWRLLCGAAFWWWPIFGVICGLAYLAKPSLAPFLLVFALAWGVGEALRLLETKTFSIQRLGGPVLAAGLFGGMLVPLGLFSHQHFGRPFFNYTRHWVWMDDFKSEAWAFQDKYPGRTQLETLPAAETPSAAWYFRRHNLADASMRLRDGTAEVAARFFFPEPRLASKEFLWRTSPKSWEQPLVHRGVYLLALGGLCVVLAAMGPREAIARILRPEGLACLVFVVLLAAIFTTLYGWYVPIGRGDRFMGSLWIPAVFLVTWLALHLRDSTTLRPAGGLYLAVHAAILLSLVLQATCLFWRFHHGLFLTTRN